MLTLLYADDSMACGEKIMNEELIKEQISDVAALMCGKNFAAGLKGSISVRLDGEQFFITAGNMPLRNTEPKKLIKLNKNFEIIRCMEGLSVTDDIDIHKKIYSSNQQIRAVLVAFPSSLCALEENPAEVRSKIKLFPKKVSKEEITVENCDSVMIADYGAAVFSDDIYKAYSMLEELALDADITLKKRISGSVL